MPNENEETMNAIENPVHVKHKNQPFIHEKNKNECPKSYNIENLFTLLLYMLHDSRQTML